jgi:hypothetical protein
MAIGRIPEPGTGIPESIVDAKGDIVTATAADTPARLAVGTNDHRLVAASGEATGLKYVADTQNTVVDAKGDLLVGTAADTIARLAVGTNGYTLVADSSVSPTGLKWAAPASGGLTYSRLASTSGTATSLVYTITSGYENLYLAWNVSNPGSMLMRLNSLSTADYQNSYAHKIFSVNNTTSTSITLDGAVTINSGGYWNGIIKISDVNGNKPFVSWQCCTNGNGTDLDITGIANYNTNITLTTVQLFWTNSQAYELVEWGAN